jgi:DNA polymerase I
MKKLLLIDTFNFLHRAYHALPKTFTDSEGTPTNAVYGVASMMINIFDSIKPDYAVAALDSEEPTFRVENFTSYKAHRKPMEDDLSVQIKPVFEIIEAFGVRMLTVNGYEADDIIGTLAHRLGGDEQDLQIIIASNDRDLWQLVNENVVVMLPSTKGSAEWLGPREVGARLGFDPKLLIDYKGLRGDASDNIPGVFGVGEKTAKSLIEKFGTLEEIYKNIDSVMPLSLREKLLNCYETALMSKNLATIDTNVPLTMALEQCRYKEVDKLGLKRVLERYRFKSLIKRLGLGEEGDGFMDGNGKKKTVEVNENQVSLF